MTRPARIFLLTLLLGSCAWAADGPVETAQRQFEAGNYAAAVRTLHSALTQSPKQARLYYWLGRSYFEMGDYKDAIAQAEQSVKLDPRNSDYHLWLGRAYGREAERVGGLAGFSLARKTKHEFEEAVRLNPKSIPARRDLMEFYATAPWVVGGSKDKAQEQLAAIAALDPLEGALAHGEFLKDQKKLDLAEAEYRRVMQAKPNRVGPYFEVADFYQRRGDATRMQEAVEEAARIDPADQRLVFYRAVILVLAGKNLTQAEQYLKAYLATVPERSDFPSHAQARVWLGQLYERLGKRIEAAEQYRAALQLDPGLDYARASLQRLEKASR